MLATLLVSILSNLLTILIPVSIGKYYDLVFDFNSHRSKIFDFLPFDIGKDIQAFLFFFFILVVFKSIFLFIEKYSIGLLSEQLAHHLRTKLFNAQMQLPISIYEEKGIGKYLLRFSGDLKSIQSYFSNGIIRFVSDVCLFFVTIGVLLYFHFQLGLLVTGILIITSIFILLLNKKLSTFTRLRRNRKSMLLSFVNTRLRSIHSIRYFNKESIENKKFSKHSNKVLEAGISYQTITAFIKTLVPTSMYLMLGIVLWMSFHLSQTSEAINGSTLLIFVMLLITLLPIFRRLLKVNIVWELGNISFEKLLKVLNQQDFTSQEWPNLVVEDGNIQLENISFAYKNEAYLLDNLNWHLPSNSISLVSGSSGSGKGTVIKLITGLYKANKGKIFIDQQDISQVNPKSLRKNIAVVSNSIPLLGKTVFEAISYSRKANKRPKAQAMLDSLQYFLPLKQRLELDDRIGDLGNNLSKGQQKLLVYARAFLTNKKVLLIDEPCSDLDEATAIQICKMLEEMKERKTIVLFSRQERFLFLKVDHRFQTNDLFQFYSL